MIKEQKHQSEFQIALDGFKRNRFAVACVVILCLLYVGAIFADFLAPYSFKNEDRNYSYCPPTKIHFTQNGKLSWPYVQGIDLTFNEYYRRVYVPDVSKKYPLQFFAKGDSYKLFGIIPAGRHLFGVEEGGRIYLLGADSRGRDLFSRLLYGGRVSLSIGLIGVLISFSIGLIVGGIAGYYGGWVDRLLSTVTDLTWVKDHYEEK